MKSLRLRELIARGLVFGLLLGLLGAVYVSRQIGRSDWTEIHVSMSESEGWAPGDLKATVGQPLKLRLVSDDVMHGFKVAQTDWPALDLPPGVPVETTLVFDQPGRYTFYCTRWCGLSHWRMRGVIEVSGTDTAASEKSEPPLYTRLGIDLDAPHPAAVTPAARPSAPRAPALSEAVPAEMQTGDYYRANSPVQAWQALRSQPALSYLDDQQLWNLTAALWQRQTNPQALQAGAELYAQNCAACHGESGRGDGVMSAALAASMGNLPTPQHGMSDMSTEAPAGISGHTTVAPTNFTDPALLGAAPALLHGKIVRGGMGTGMPYWGPIFTDEQIWSIVAFLYTFQFEAGGG